MLLLTEGVNGQSIRLGAEGNCGLGAYFEYDEYGFYENRSFNNLTLSANLFADIIFPRSWTPNWIALSTQIGMGFMQMRNNDDFFYYVFDKNGEPFSRGFNVPLNLEVKFLMSDNVRLFFNAGVVNYLTLSYDTYSYSSESVSAFDEDWARFYMFGYNYGFGFEFGALRIGYKLTNFTKTILKENIGNKYKNIHTLSLGIMFNGNRFLKKKSYLKVY